MFEAVAGNLERYMSLLSVRQKLVASNIANADTPGYRPKDLDFNAVMKSAVEASANGSAQDGNLMARASADIESAIYEPKHPNSRQGEDRLDGNAVSLDSQMALLTENSLGYEASLTFLQRALAGLRFAIREGRG